MKKQNSINSAFALLLFVFIVLACSGGANQTAEANKIVDEANKLVEEAKDLSQKTEARNQALFSVQIQTQAQLRYYKAKVKDQALDIAVDFGKAAEKADAAAKKFSEAAKLNLPDKYKEYLNLKSQEFTKRAEGINVRKGNAQAFVDYDDPSVMVKRFNENNAKSQKLMDEADEISKKADKVHDDNKDIFKS